jgi:glycerol-3-phosphate acyltransferase PlsY
VATIVAFAFAYLIGSIPTGVLLGRLAGIDVRSQGSGNIGATNVARTAGRTLGILTLVGDALKGLVPVVAARVLALGDAAAAGAAVGATCGHMFSIFLSFRGGKGVATGLGALLGVAPAAVLIPLGVFTATVALSRIVSLGSILAALSAPLAVAVLGYPPPTARAATAMGLLIVLRHHENITRLLAGKEQRFESKKT